MIEWNASSLGVLLEEAWMFQSCERSSQRSSSQGPLLHKWKNLRQSGPARPFTLKLTKKTQLPEGNKERGPGALRISSWMPVPEKDSTAYMVIIMSQVNYQKGCQFLQTLSYEALSSFKVNREIRRKEKQENKWEFVKLTNEKSIKFETRKFHSRAYPSLFFSKLTCMAKGF